MSVNKYTVLLENVLSRAVIIRNVNQIKRLDADKIIKTDLPTEFMKDLKILTEFTANDLLQFPLLRQETRKSLRVPKSKIREKSTRNNTEDTIEEEYDDEEEESLKLNLFDSLSLLSTIFEEEEDIEV